MVEVTQVSAISLQKIPLGMFNHRVTHSPSYDEFLRSTRTTSMCLISSWLNRGLNMTKQQNWRQHLGHLSLLLGLAIASGVHPPSWAANLAEIQERGRLVVGVKENLRPLGFRDEQGQLQGLEIELARQIAAQLLGDRAAVEFVPVRNDQRLDLLLADEVDLVIAQMTATPMRSRLVYFSRPYYVEHVSLIARQPQATPDTWKQQRLALLQGSNAIALVRKAAPSATLIGVNSYQAAFELLETGAADAFVGDHAVLVGWAQTESVYQVQALNLESFGGNAIAIAIAKGYQQGRLLVEINTILQDLQTSGWFTEQYEQWGLSLKVEG